MRGRAGPARRRATRRSRVGTPQRRAAGATRSPGDCNLEEYFRITSRRRGGRGGGRKDCRQCRARQAPRDRRAIVISKDISRLHRGDAGDAEEGSGSNLTCLGLLISHLGPDHDSERGKPTRLRRSWRRARADASKIMTTVPPCARGPCFGRGAETWAECRAVTGAPSSEAAGDQSWPEIMASR